MLRDVAPRSTLRDLIACAIGDALLLPALAIGTPVAIICALLVHLALVATVVRRMPAGSRRQLAATWMLALPGIGLPIAFLTMRTRGNGDMGEFQRSAPVSREQLPSQHVRAVAGHVPICERLSSGVPRTRRSALTALAARRDADAVTILRWAVRQPDGELALDAALTLDELVDSYEARRVETRAKIALVPTFENFVEAAYIIVDALWTRLADDAMVHALAEEASGYFARAIALVPERVRELAESRAKVAIIALRPEDAIAYLEAEMQQPRPNERIVALYNQAVAHARQYVGQEQRHAA